MTRRQAFLERREATVLYLGEPAGFVVELENGTTIYFAGDTCVFGDMQLIGRIYAPGRGVLPIGEHYTMGPREAARRARAARRRRRCIPCHYGTFRLAHRDPGRAAREPRTPVSTSRCCRPSRARR